MKILRVRNWEKFQHYKDRGPVWIKAYTELLDDPSFLALPDAAKGQLLAVWLLAAKRSNRLPFKRNDIRVLIGATGKLYLDDLIQGSWLEVIDEQPAHRAASNGAINHASNGAITSRARAQSREGEKEGEKETPSSSARGDFGFAVQHGNDARFQAFREAIGPKRQLAWFAILDQWGVGERLPLGLRPSTDQLLDSLAAAVTAHDGGPMSERYVLRCVEETVRRQPNQRNNDKQPSSFLALHDSSQKGVA